jgi:hypothetical protein
VVPLLYWQLMQRIAVGPSATAPADAPSPRHDAHLVPVGAAG